MGLDLNTDGMRDPFSYARAALDAECATLASTGHGRNDQVNRSAFALGQFVPGGYLSRSEIEHRIMAAAEVSGIVRKDGVPAARASMRSGLESGMRQPRDLGVGEAPRTTVHVLRPRPQLSGVDLPEWTEPGEDGKPKFGSIGRAEPYRFDDEARRHLYIRDGVVVRVKVKSTSGGFLDWYLVKRPSDNAIGWQAKKPDGFVPCPYLSPSARDPFDAARRGETLVWGEGEKDTDALCAEGFGAFTFGSASDVPDVSDLLHDHAVIIAVDNDEAGRKSIPRKVGAAIQAGARSIRLVQFLELPDGGDAADFFAAGGDAEAFMDRAERIDPTTWQAEPEQEAGQSDRSDNAQPESEAKPKRTHKAKRGTNDTRPVIALRNGEIAAAVDAAEDALIAAGGLYQRGNQIVLMGEAPVKTHDDKEVTASRIFEVGEYALAEKIASAACVMKFDARVNDDIVTNPPSWLVKTLQQRTGHFRFQILTAIINAPTLRPDGSLLDVPGYDEVTGLYYDPRGVEFPKIPESPTRRDAERALADLSELLGGFPFETEDGRAVALSVILTACVRQGLPTAPMHGFSAPTAGSGKGKLVDVSSVVATGREAGVIPQCASEEELEKRIDAELLEGAGAIAIDNCTHPIDGNKLCSMLTQATVSIRPLGGSKRVTVPTSVLLSCTGNNLVVQGDMTRRVVVARLDAGVERPELREFDFEPVARAKAERVRYVVAALTIMRAYKAAGSPPQSKPLGSFEKWSRLVRDALLWLGCGDPVTTMEAARGLDPKLSELSEVLSHWKSALGTDRITVRRIIEKTTRQSVDSYGNTSREFEHPDMREALMAVAGQGGVINGRKLAKWLGAQSGRIVGGLSIEQGGTEHAGAMSWRVVDRSRKPGATQAVRLQEEEAGHDIPF